MSQQQTNPNPAQGNQQKRMPQQQPQMHPQQQFFAQQMFMPQMHPQMPIDPNQLAAMNSYYQQQMQMLASQGAAQGMINPMMMPQMSMQGFGQMPMMPMPGQPQQHQSSHQQSNLGVRPQNYNQPRSQHVQSNQQSQRSQTSQQTQMKLSENGGAAEQPVSDQSQVNKAQIGPKSTLSEDCPKHAGQKIVFKITNSDNQKEQFCEKCFAEHSKSRTEARNIAQEKAGAQASDDLLSRLKAPSQPLQTADLAEEEDEVEPQLSEKDQVMSLHKKIESLCQSLAAKIHKKHEGLYLQHQHFALYESTLNEKYQPVFTQMKELIQEKRVDYMNYLNRQLLKNDETVRLERGGLARLQNSLQSIQDQFRADLETQLAIIKEKEKEEEKQIAEAKKQAEEARAENADGEQAEPEEAKKVEAEESKEETKEQGAEEEVKVVDSSKISALNKMLDDFENILSKNFCQFANYEDFSFAKSRTTESLQEQFFQFFDQHFQGDFRIKNQFLQNVIPRLYYPQQGSKFIHCFKILNNISQIVNIQNQFALPERSRCIVSAEGACYLFGGYLPQLRSFLNNTFILDEHRSNLVALQPMKTGRADHALHIEGDQIFVLGGMNFRADTGSQTGQVESLNSCEVYSISKDEWSEMASFEHARQQFSVCQFNEKFLFIFGGKRIKVGRANIDTAQPFEFVQEVEVFDIEKKLWKTLNYISEPQRLAVIAPGVTQLAGSQIMIFGGIVPATEQENFETLEEGSSDLAAQQVFNDSGTKVSLTAKSIILDVTVGSLKSGPELAIPSYFISGGYKMLHSNQVFAFGLGVPPALIQSAASSLAAQDDSEKRRFVFGATQHKKIIHCYKAAEAKWLDMNETFFGGQRRDSDLED